jgi:hypothetical protein
MLNGNVRAAATAALTGYLVFSPIVQKKIAKLDFKKYTPLG